MSEERMSNEQPDELDRLYGKIEWENPRPNLSARVMARIRVTQRVQRISAALSLVALAALGVFAFALGRGMTLSGTLDYVIVLSTNLDVMFDGADEFLSALVDGVPWLTVAALFISALGLWLASVVLPRFLTTRQSRLH
jgi:hypothetical protein